MLLLIKININKKSEMVGQFCDVKCSENWFRLVFPGVLPKISPFTPIELGYGNLVCDLYLDQHVAVVSADTSCAELNSNCWHCRFCGVLVNSPESCSYHIHESCPDRNVMVTTIANYCAVKIIEFTKGHLDDQIWQSIETTLLSYREGFFGVDLNEIVLKAADNAGLKFGL